ncbi:hypothetical protein ACFV2N_07345 [Streptomyces sp. NPDC059680]|nr:hypothetical protein [Streptomyces barringtoniae]MCC5477657.1 hypothetical protein [Streptomyces barringtoniae]
MIAIAVLLLPVLAILLFGLDQVEDRWILHRPTSQTRPHRHRRVKLGRR